MSTGIPSLPHIAQRHRRLLRQGPLSFSASVRWGNASSATISPQEGNNLQFSELAGGPGESIKLQESIRLPPFGRQEERKFILL
jgi:hypothetical protein